MKNKATAVPGGPGANGGGALQPSTAAGFKNESDRNLDGIISASGTSLFDPVLAELICRWFCPPGGLVLDPFAGEANKGIITVVTGRRYVGIELRSEQVAANELQWPIVKGKFPEATERPLWIVGNSEQIIKHAKKYGPADLIFTSPPYYDLELYSNDVNDGSAKQSYEEFMQFYERVFASAISCLADNRFLVVKVGEIRDRKTGAYRGFVAHNIVMFQKLGLSFYNDAILVTAVGSLPVRAGRVFASSRKLGKTHQNVLIFYKGDTRHVARHHKYEAPFGNIEPEESEGADN